MRFKWSIFDSATDDAVQVRMHSNSQNTRFLATDGDDNIQFQIHFRDDEIMFLGASNKQEWLSVSAAGIVSAGPTCSPNPCDRTFDPTYFEVAQIEERAAYMWENMHLPAVGPTKANAPMNLTQKTAGMLHELEVAHIYIEQLHSRLKTQETTVASQASQLSEQSKVIEGLLARMTVIEAQ